jgi:outer membrane lipoprotein-sorting protein
MSVMTSRPALRWLVPVSAAAAVLAGGAAIGALTAAADRSLPPRSAAELLVDLQTARLDGMSGTIVYQADLGLPALPGLGGGAIGGAGDSLGSTDLAALVSGTHTLRVWYSGPDKARVALLGTLGETDIILNQRDLWIWDSRANTATHQTLPDESTLEALPSPSATGGVTPRQLADLALAAINPSTEVTTAGPVTIAGRGAYELVLAPRDATSLVASVRLAVDAEEKVPLRVQIFARGYDNPALEAAFTQVSFDRPDDSQFAFNPPPGTQVTEAETPTKPDQPGATPGESEVKPEQRADRTGGPEDRRSMATVGSGWTTVVVLRVPEPTAEESDGGAAGESDRTQALARLLERLPKVSLPGGGTGTVLTSRLFSVLVTDDGRVLLGAVTAERLAEAAADPAAQLPS